MGLLYDTPRRVSWNPPEGTWSATCHTILDLSDEVKINFTVDIPGAQTIEYRAGNKYEGILEEGTPLYRDLYSWLKGDFSILRNEQGKLDLRRLTGVRADLVLVHMHTGRENPFVHIATIRPVGTLVRNGGDEVLRKAA